MGIGSDFNRRSASRGSEVADNFWAGAGKDLELEPVFNNDLSLSFSRNSAEGLVHRRIQVLKLLFDHRSCSNFAR